MPPSKAPEACAESALGRAGHRTAGIATAGLHARDPRRIGAVVDTAWRLGARCGTRGGHSAMTTATPAADTGRSWALFPQGLLVFERAAPEASHLLVSRVEACTTPGCESRDIGLRAVTVVADDSFDPALLSSDALLARFANEAMEARLDIDTGNVTPDDYDGRVPLSAEWLQYLQSQIDGELLDVLHEKWLHGKGMKSVPKTDWESRDPGA